MAVVDEDQGCGGDCGGVVVEQRTMGVGAHWHRQADAHKMKAGCKRLHQPLAERDSIAFCRVDANSEDHGRANRATKARRSGAHMRHRMVDEASDDPLREGSLACGALP